MRVRIHFLSNPISCFIDFVKCHIKTTCDINQKL